MNCWRSPVPSLVHALVAGFVSFGIALPASAIPAVLFTQDPDGRVNVRSAPGTASEPRGQGQTGDRLTIMRETQAADRYPWYYVQFNDAELEGWVRADLVRVFAESAMPDASVEAGVYWIGPTGVGLRVEGDRYQIYDETGDGDWRRVTELQPIREGVLHDGQTFWCAASHMPETIATCTANGWEAIPPNL